MRLRPGKKTNWIVRYVVAVIAKKRKIKIYAICVLSDHWHLVIHDAFGNVVDFTRECHQFIAQAINHVHGDEGSLWNSGQTSHVRPVAPADTLSRIGYTMANPVKHGAVVNAKNWPGVRHVWPDRPRTIKRPPFYFDDGDDSVWPDEVVLEMERPLGYEHLDDDELAAEIQRAIEAAEESFRIERAERGLGFMTRRACRRRSRWARATSPEKKSRRNRSVACEDPERFRLELAAQRRWRAEYADCLARWRAGDREVVFPHGTYLMRVVHRVNVAPPPPT